MNVIIVNDFADTNGGAAQVALSSAVGLALKGHRVTFFAAVLPVATTLLDAGIEVVVTNQYEIARDPNRLRAMKQGIWNGAARVRFRQMLKRFDASTTVVHVHGWSKALSSSVLRECMDLGYRVVCTLHDYFIACPNGGFYNFRTASICHLRPLSVPCIASNCDSRNYAQKQWRVVRQVVQQGVGRVPGCIDAFIAVSSLSLDVLRPFLPVGSPVSLIRNPIVCERESAVKIARQSPFACVGRLSPEKGGVLLAHAARTSACDLIYIGDGDCRAEIERANPAARITGWLPRVEAMTTLREARALILPSLWYETQGMVVLEAAAMGIPAIVPDTSAARDLVEHGVTGLWFKGADAKSLSMAMAELLDLETVNRLGAAAYEKYWSDPPTLDRHVQALEEVYHSLLRT